MWELTCGALSECRIDVPVAPKALGYLVGAALAEEGVLDLEDLPELLSQLEEAESKRLISAVACKTLKVRLSKNGERVVRPRFKVKILC